MATTAPSVMITGASKGIGHATALHLDRRGFHVFAGVRREADAQTLRDVASERLTPIIVDVTDATAVADAVDRVEREHSSGLTGLVNNAGIVVAGPMEFLPLDQFRMQLEVNLVGVLALTQAFLPLIRRGKGRIVNVSSINGKIAIPFVGAYAASKFGLEALSDALRVELRRWRIPVTVIEPGAIETPIWDTSTRRANAIAGDMPEAARKLYGGVLKRLADQPGRAPKHAIPPDRVARTIERALTARKPKTRYLVGLDARVGAFANWLLPDRWRDRLLTQ